MQPLIALVDCNNFYVSCERVFRPDLIGKPKEPQYQRAASVKLDAAIQDTRAIIAAPLNPLVNFQSAQMVSFQSAPTPVDLVVVTACKHNP